MKETAASVTVSCSLALTEAAVLRALQHEGPAPFALPLRHPLAAYDLDGGPCGPIPRVLRLSTFEWAGGEASGSRRALRAFVGLTTGAARFFLVDVDGRARGYEVKDGQLFDCKVKVRLTRKRAGR